MAEVARGTPFLLLRLEAPLMAFGGPVVDFVGPTRRFPGQAQIAGMLGNALGYRHGDADALTALQARLRLAAAVLRPGELLRDYQTVDLGQPHLVGTGWTTRGALEKRDGASSEGTHIRIRWHLADACVLVALTLDPSDEAPNLADLDAAVLCPARPLFIGRKPCLPTAPIRLGLVDAADAADALRQGAASLADAGMPFPQDVQVEGDARLPGLPNHGQAGGLDGEERLVDRRDWRNGLHTGARTVHRGSLRLVLEEGR